MSIPVSINPLGISSDKCFTLIVKPGILGSSLTYGFTPYWRSGGYCKVIDWGDGTSEDAVTNQASISHTYSSAGTYKIKVKADCYKFYFGLNTEYAPLIYDSNGNWDEIGNITNASDMFSGCENAVFAFTSLPDGLTTASGMFRGCTNARLSLTSLPAGITSATQMFSRCVASTLPLTSLPDSITKARGMFGSCRNAELNLTALPSSMTTCDMMFKCTLPSKLKVDLDAVVSNAPVNGWPDITSLKEMFWYCPGVTGSRSAFLAKFPNVTNTSNTFTGTNTTV